MHNYNQTLKFLKLKISNEMYKVTDILKTINYSKAYLENDKEICMQKSVGDNKNNAPEKCSEYRGF